MSVSQKVAPVVAFLAASALVAPVASSAQAIAATTPVVSSAVSLTAEQKVLALNGTNAWPFASSTNIEDALQGYMCTGEFECDVVDYDNYIISFTPRAKKAKILSDELQAQTEPIVVSAYSQGAMLVHELHKLRQEGKLPAPVVQESYVLIGDPGHGLNGISRGSVVNAGYPTVQVSKMGDFFSDFPNNPFNLLAVAETLAGLMYNHRHYEDVDINSPDNLFYQDGETTYILVPRDGLALTRPLRQLGLDDLADALDKIFVPIIDKAYDRSMYEEQTPLDEVAPQDVDQNALVMSATSDNAANAVPGSVSRQFSLVSGDQEVSSDQPDPVQPVGSSDEEQVDQSQTGDEPALNDEQETDESVEETLADEEESTVDEAEQEAEAESEAAEQEEAAEEQSSEVSETVSESNVSDDSNESEDNADNNES